MRIKRMIKAKIKGIKQTYDILNGFDSFKF
jgi:hypothetical protein